MTGSVDPQVLIELAAVDAGSGEGLVARVINSYRKSGEDCLTGIEKAFEESDDASLATQAHRFKGACLQIGAVPLSEICHTLDRVASKKQDGDLETLLEELREEYARVLEVLSRYAPAD